MPAEYYLDTIKTVFQDFALVKGTWVVAGEQVRPQDITGMTALMTIEGELDDISGAGQTRAAHELCEGIPKDRQFYDEYNAVLDMPAEYYLETIKTVFQDFSLVNGTWEVKGTLVRPQDIRTTALLTIEGELDDISGAGQTRAAHDLCTGIAKTRQFHYDVVGAGHYGIFSGRRWREHVHPEVSAFIARFGSDAALTTAPTPRKPAAKKGPARRR